MTTPRKRAVRTGLAALAAVLSLTAMVLLIGYRSSSGEKFRRQAHINCVQIELIKRSFRDFINDILTPPEGTKLTPQQQANVDRIRMFSNSRFQPKPCV